MSRKMQTHVLTNERDSIGANVTICKNVLFFGVKTAIKGAYANGVTRCSKSYSISASASACLPDNGTEGGKYMRRASVFTAPDAQCASNRPLPIIRDQ
jgi:hypothetical protein